MAVAQTVVAVRIPPLDLPGELRAPPQARGVIVFAHGSGSSRLSPRNQAVAKSLSDAGFATLLFDLLTEPEAQALRAQGVGRHLTAGDLLVYGPHGPIDNRPRFADEPARHKVLDAIGDLALCGFDLAGHVVAYRSGHALNVELARKLAALAAPRANAA